MNLETIVTTVGWLLIVAVLVGPTAYRLINNLRTAYRIRQHKKNLPGPLLGVVYPTHNKNKKDKK